MAPPTLRGRLALVAAAAIAVWIALLTLGFNEILSTALERQASSVLQDRATAAAAAVYVTPSGTVAVREVSGDEAIDANVWVYQGTTVVERPRASAALQSAVDRLAARGSGFADVERPRAARIYALPVAVRGRRIATVVALVNIDPYRNAARLALAGSVGLGLLLLAGVYAVTRLLIGRALVPVRQMSEQAAEWGAHSSPDRFGDTPRPRELAELAANLDGVLDRLAALLRHEQQLTEELSHELRTPLALITAENDLLGARRRSAAEREQARQRIGAAAGQMTEILETLLTAARSRVPGSAGRCDVAATCRRAVEHVTSDRLRFEVRAAPEVYAGVDAAILERILAPLLDNAVRYAGSAIYLEVGSAGGQVVVLVSDDGPGLPESLGATVFEPGVRGPGDDAHAGAGLGLALARRLARAAGGDLLAAPGGALEIRLPSAGPA